jgi:hypothetical protein
VVAPSPSLATNHSTSLIKVLSLIEQSLFVGPDVGKNGLVHTFVPAIKNLRTCRLLIKDFDTMLKDSARSRRPAA